MQPGKVYHYTLVVLMSDASERRSSALRIITPSVRSMLGQNHPNPFNPGTTIEYSVHERARVNLVVYDVNGSVVRELVDGWRDAGSHVVSWDGTNSAGAGLASGVYFYSLTVGGKATSTRRMVLLK